MKSNNKIDKRLVKIVEKRTEEFKKYFSTKEFETENINYLFLNKKPFINDLLSFVYFYKKSGGVTTLINIDDDNYEINISLPEDYLDMDLNKIIEYIERYFLIKYKISIVDDINIVRRNKILKIKNKIKCIK